MRRFLAVILLLLWIPAPGMGQTLYHVYDSEEVKGLVGAGTFYYGEGKIYLFPYWAQDPLRTPEPAPVPDCKGPELVTSYRGKPLCTSCHAQKEKQLESADFHRKHRQSCCVCHKEM